MSLTRTTDGRKSTLCPDCNGSSTPRKPPAGTSSALQSVMPNSHKKLEELDKLIEGIEVAMFTTRRADGHLVSRPMATQKRIKDADVWFVTNADTHKDDEIELDPHVNCAYYNNHSREWV